MPVRLDDWGLLRLRNTRVRRDDMDGGGWKPGRGAGFALC